MKKNQIEEAVYECYNNLIDEISVENQLAELLKKYPEEYREEIEEMVYELCEDEWGC